MNRIRHLYASYGAWGLSRLARDWALTRLIVPNARLIRQPVYLRGKRWMKLGPGLTTGRGLRLEAFQSQGDTPTLTIGRDVQLNDYVHIAAACSVVIGDRVLIASRVFITDHQHGSYSGSGPQDHPWSAPAERPLTCEPVWIEDDVWIGEGVCILPGVRIGRGAVVGANSTVTRDVPAQTIVAGSPAHIVKLFCIATATWERV